MSKILTAGRREVKSKTTHKILLSKNFVRHKVKFVNRNPLQTCSSMPGRWRSQIMKIITLFLLFACLQSCFGQTDTNVIATGDWSETVTEGDHTLRGRLLVYDEQSRSAANHARVYLELQHVFKGGWANPLEVYFDSGIGNALHLELRDGLDQPIPQAHVAIRGPVPSPCWITLPCDSTVRLRADTYTLGPLSKPDGLEILVRDGCWIIRPNATNDFFLSGSFTPPKDHPSCLNYHVWQGTLKLPQVKIPVKKP